jgi:hypothetical protein
MTCGALLSTRWGLIERLPELVKAAHSRCASELTFIPDHFKGFAASQRSCMFPSGTTRLMTAHTMDLVVPGGCQCDTLCVCGISRLPAYPLACMPACSLACLLACLLARWLARSLACLPACLRGCLHTCLHVGVLAGELARLAERGVAWRDV